MNVTASGTLIDEIKSTACVDLSVTSQHQTADVDFVPTLEVCVVRHQVISQIPAGANAESCAVNPGIFLGIRILTQTA